MGMLMYSAFTALIALTNLYRLSNADDWEELAHAPNPLEMSSTEDVGTGTDNLLGEFHV